MVYKMQESNMSNMLLLQEERRTDRESTVSEFKAEYGISENVDVKHCIAVLNVDKEVEISQRIIAVGTELKRLSVPKDTIKTILLGKNRDVEKPLKEHELKDILDFINTNQILHPFECSHPFLKERCVNSCFLHGKLDEGLYPFKYQTINGYNVFTPHAKALGIRLQASFIPNCLMRIKWLSWPAKALWGRLAQYAGVNGKAYPPQDMLAAELGMSIASLKKYVKELELRGFLLKENPSGKKRVMHYRNGYHLVLHPVFLNGISLEGLPR